MVSAVVLDSWQYKSGRRGFSVVGACRWLGQGSKGISSSYSMQDDFQGITHWIIGANSGWRGVFSPETRDISRWAQEGVRGRW